MGRTGNVFWGRRRGGGSGWVQKPDRAGSGSLQAGQPVPPITPEQGRSALPRTGFAHAPLGLRPVARRLAPAVGRVLPAGVPRAYRPRGGGGHQPEERRPAVAGAELARL